MADFTSQICAVSAPFPGVTQWLEHGRREKLWDLRILGDSDSIELPECEWYLFGAWHQSYMPIIDLLKANKRKVAIAWSSSAVEMDFQQVEILYAIALQGEATRDKIDAWACLNADMAEFFPNGMHLPAPIHVEPHTGNGIRGGLAFYAPSTMKKNVFPQLLAAKRFQNDDPSAEDRYLRTNLENYNPIFEGYGIKHRLEPWLESHANHLQRLSQAKVALAAGHGESWSYATVDALSVGTPVVGSPTIPWLPDAWRCKNPNSPLDILGVLRRVWEDPGIEPREWLIRVAREQNEAARVAIERLLAT